MHILFGHKSTILKANDFFFYIIRLTEQCTQFSAFSLQFFWTLINLVKICYILILFFVLFKFPIIYYINISYTRECVCFFLKK